MSTLKVDTLDTRTGTGNITVSRPLSGLSGSGASLTALNATQLTSGTVPDARFPATLPAASGVNLTALNGSNIASGTVPTARLGSGTANNGVFLRGDGTWNAAGGGVDGITSSASSTSMNISSAGEITKPLNPTVLAYVNTTQSNVTGDGTQYAVTGAFWTEVKDYNADFSNGTFTAPVTGVYLIMGTVQQSGVVSSHSASGVMLVASNRTIRGAYHHAYNSGGSNAHLQVTVGALVDMDAADTCYLRVETDASSKVIDIAANQTWFSATLIG